MQSTPYLSEGSCLLANLQRSHLKFAYGMHTTIDADDTVVTGLKTVLAAFTSQETDLSLDDLHSQAVVGDQAGSPAAGSIQIKTWKATNNTDNVTPTPTLTAWGKKISWMAIGF